MSTNPITVYIANDHAGYDLKVAIVNMLNQMDVDVVDLGSSTKESVDYPLYARDLALKMQDSNESTFGILVCGTGTGMAIGANRFPWLRASVFDGRFDILRLAREKNHINTLCFGAAHFDISQLSECLEIFLKSKEQGDRHQRRVSQLSDITPQS